MPSKGTTGERGYGAQHQALRKEYAPLVRSGQAHCARCGQPIHPNAEWDLGHTPQRSGHTGPEHTHCNRTPAGATWNRTPEPHPGIRREGHHPSPPQPDA